MNTIQTQLNQLHQDTQTHRAQHGCGAYSFNDGRGLMKVVHTHQPNRILELGSALGYTSACMAFAAAAAKIDTIEADHSHVRLARDHLAQLGLTDRVEVHQGYFEEVLKELTGSYDLIFFDGYEPSMDLLTQLRQRLTDKGILVCANLGLAHGTQSRAMLQELNDQSRWQTVFSLEMGSTAVCRKV